MLRKLGKVVTCDGLICDINAIIFVCHRCFSEVPHNFVHVILSPEVLEIKSKAPPSPTYREKLLVDCLICLLRLFLTGYIISSTYISFGHLIS